MAAPTPGPTLDNTLEVVTSDPSSRGELCLPEGLTYQPLQETEAEEMLDLDDDAEQPQASASPEDMPTDIDSEAAAEEDDEVIRNGKATQSFDTNPNLLHRWRILSSIGCSSWMNWWVAIS